jgi:hypothetical protein
MFEDTKLAKVTMYVNDDAQFSAGMKVTATVKENI